MQNSICADAERNRKTKGRTLYEPKASLQGAQQNAGRCVQRSGRIYGVGPHGGSHCHGAAVPCLGHRPAAVYHCGICNAGADGLNGAVKLPLLSEELQKTDKLNKANETVCTL